MRTVKRALASVIIFWGLLALLVRSATPFIADYRPYLEAALSTRLGAPVEIDAISARWHGLRPLIELGGIRLGQGDEHLAINRAAIDIAPMGLFELLGGATRERLIEAVRLTLDGLALTAVREPDGRIHLEGLGPIRPAGDALRPSWLPSRLQLVNTRLRWVDRKVGSPPLTFPDLAILVERDGPRLDLRARLETAAGTADAAARLEGFLDTTNWSGNSYLRVANLDVARLLAPYLPAYYGLRSLRLNVQSWVRWNDATPVHSAGEFSLRQLRLRPTAPGAGDLDLAAASAEFSLRRDADRVLIGLKGLRLAMPEHVWPKGDIAVSVERGKTGTVLAVYADYLDLADLRQIARVRLPWPNVVEALDGLRPRGALKDLRLRLRLPGTERGPDWRGRAQVEGLAWSPWRKAPGLEGIDGRLEGQTGLARLTMDSRDNALQFESLFRAPLVFDRVTGAIELAYDADGWSARSQRLVVHSPHLDATTRFALRRRTDDRLFLDLQTDFANGDARAVSRYLPTGVMGSRLVTWLDQAFEAGRVDHGSALFHGPIEDFPFEKTRSGSFQVDFETMDVDLHYRAGWPILERLAANVRFSGNQLDIQAHSGQIYDSRVERLDARFASLKPVSALELKGTLVGPLADQLRVLREDALRDRFGRFAAAVRASGNARLDLDFAVALGHREENRLQGALTFLDNGLALPEWALELTQLDGGLDFTLDGISGRGIRAKALGGPVRIDVGALESGGTRVRVEAQLSPGDIMRQLPALPLQAAEGRSGFVVDVDIPARRAPGEGAVVLGVGSDLKGIRIRLPEPVGKGATEVRPLAVRIPLGDGGGPGSLRYGKQLTARFSTDGQRIGVSLGGAAATLPARAGLRLTGRLEELDTEAWQAALSGRLRPVTAEIPPVDAELQIARIVRARHAVEDVTLKLTHADGEWAGDVRAPTIAGRFRIPADIDSDRVEVDLERLTLRYPIPENTGPSPVPNPADAVDPTELPGLALTIAQMRINDAELGTLRLDAAKSPAGLRVPQLTLTGGALEMDGQIEWTKGPDGIATQLDGRASTKGLGDLLVGLGYSRQLEESPGQMGVTLGWPGDPSQVHATTLEGRVTLDVGAGRLVELDPGVTRVFGLLNLNALTRRLRLDFRDFYTKGYSFDSIVGAFEFKNGSAATEELKVLGPSGRIEIQGRADLQARTLDQKVRITPNLNATLPIAGAIAGGPIAGVAVLVAQQVLSNEVDAINRFEYSVSGDWANPEIRQLDSGGALSKLLGPLRRSTGETAAGAPSRASPQDAETDRETDPSAPSKAAPPERVDSSPLTRPIRGLIDALKKGKTDTDNLLIDQD